eukprot:IDg16130t1
MSCPHPMATSRATRSAVPRRAPSSGSVANVLHARVSALLLARTQTRSSMIVSHRALTGRPALHRITQPCHARQRARSGLSPAPVRRGVRVGVRERMSAALPHASPRICTL